MSIKLDFKQSHELLHTLLIRHHPEARLDYFLIGNDRSERVKLCILDACRLLELGIRLGLSRDELWARAKGGDVPSDGARLEQLETIILLIRQKGNKHERTPIMIRMRRKRWSGK